MKKDKNLIIIILITILLITMILLINRNIRYNNLVVSQEKWNTIIKEKTNNNKLQIEKLYFNDYPSIIDQKNNTIHYIMMNSRKKTNPLINYFTSKKDAKIIIKESKKNDKEIINIMVYYKTTYNVYELVKLNNPIININYNKLLSKTPKAEILILDNNIKSIQKIIKSTASLTITDNNEYIISLSKESLGRNKRENEISILGNTRENTFIIKKDNREENQFNKKIELFINNEYQGSYKLEFNERNGG